VLSNQGNNVLGNVSSPNIVSNPSVPRLVGGALSKQVNNPSTYSKLIALSLLSTITIDDGAGRSVYKLTVCAVVREY